MMEQRGQGVRVSDIAKAAGVSRQALYLHFNNRTALMVATIRYADEVYSFNERLKALQSTSAGIDNLLGLIDLWGKYVPLICGLRHALLDPRAIDEAAAAAWEERMGILRESCRMAINGLVGKGIHRPDMKVKKAADLLWSLLGIELWENLTRDCGWSTTEYIKAMQDLAIRTFVRESMAF